MSFSTEKNVLRLVIIPIVFFAFWTFAHQIAVVLKLPWSQLLEIMTWLSPFILLFAIYLAERLATLYISYLPKTVPRYIAFPATYLALVGLIILGGLFVVDSFSSRFIFSLACIAIGGFISLRQTESIDPLDNKPAEFSVLTNYSILFVLICITVSIVLCANRSDFDDAEYIQFALQTLRYPDKGLYSFDASMGTIIEQFRFAPYRFTSYETFIALIISWTGVEILDVYYLLLPGITAVLSIGAAYLFLRWFLPSKFALISLAIFLLICMVWGESHHAYGNRMFVRLFQGKGLLVTLTTPVTIILTLLWMRKPRLVIWCSLLLIQAAAIGVSSTGIIITLFATMVGLLAGLLSNPKLVTLRSAFIGSLVMLYPICIGLWIKFLSSATGKIEAIGSFLPINSSLGNYGNKNIHVAADNFWREILFFAVIIIATFLISKKQFKKSNNHCLDNSAMSIRNYYWLLVVCLLFIFNPFLIDTITGFTAKNMSWRLAWAAPVPLILTIAFMLLFHWAKTQKKYVSNYIGMAFTTGLFVLFIFTAQWTLSISNKVEWGILEHKVPPEYYHALKLKEEIAQVIEEPSEVTLLVESTIGTWVTVVAPDYNLVMPGHGYPVTLRSILIDEDYNNRVTLLANVKVIEGGDKQFDALLDQYKVNTIAFMHKDGEDVNFKIVRREIK